jgi:FkbM family methyltransferase
MVRKIIRKLRVLLYQYRIKKYGNIFVKRTGLGFRIILDTSKDVDKRFLFSDFEQDNFQLIKKITEKGWKVIDVGANIGLYALTFAKLIGEKEGIVFAFEPSDEAFTKLNQNIKLNNFKNIKAFKLGVSNEIGETEFYMTEDDAYNSLGKTPMRRIIEKRNIPITTLDKFIEDNDIDEINILKIDTEGADYLVLRGATKLLENKNPPIILCEYNKITKSGYDYRLDDLIDFLELKGYEIYEIIKKKLVRFNPITSSSSELVCIQKNHHRIFQNYLIN